MINLENNNISKELFELLNGKELEEKQHEAMMLLTVSEENWPHVAMVSVGEIIAITRCELRLAIWPNTNTTKNIIRNGKATIVVVYNKKVYYIRLSLQKLPILAEAKHPRERFICTVTSFREDEAKYADILSGIQINLKDPDNVIKRWRETIDELLI